MSSHRSNLTYEDIASMLPSGTSPEILLAIYTIVQENITWGRYKRFLKSNTEISLQDYVLRVYESYETNHSLIKDIQIEKNKDNWLSFSEKLHSWAYRFLDRWELDRESQISYTQDIAQKASIAILEAYFPYDCDFYAWSCVLVHNVGSTYMRDMLKLTSLINEEIGDISDIEEWVSHSSTTHINSVDSKIIDIEDILEATQKLSASQASLIKKYYWEGKSFKEIASEEQVSINTIYKRHFDALARLRKILRDRDINE